ncbi:hypothetical protein AcV7_003829 [Taiwanofungus camphoratus]|nr:hypothetical protein AcV7_003829 [Antrodia cinnamomea]
MARSYRVFLGAPRHKDLTQQSNIHHWHTVSSCKPPPLSLPKATLEAASRRISLLYQNVIFRDSEEDNDIVNLNSGLVGDAERDGSPDHTTAISWPPTVEEIAENEDASRGAASFFHTSDHALRVRSQVETQETASYNSSDTSSITCFPAFHFSLHNLTALSSLAQQVRAQAVQSRRLQKGSRKVTIVVAVLEVDGPDAIHIKKGIDAGKEVSLLKMILGDEDGAVCKLTAWREVAESWGGACTEASTPGVKSGDVVLVENVLASWEVDPQNVVGAASLALTASPYLKSKLEICYRTMPYMPEDNRFRPDLRLGFSDAAVRKVAAVVNWFEGMAGLPVS